MNSARIGKEQGGTVSGILFLKILKDLRKTLFFLKIFELKRLQVRK